MSEQLVSQISISICCKDLADLDITSLSDPQVILHIWSNNEWKEHSKTEIIWNNLNPKFASQLILDYHFESVQKLKFLVIDVDEESPKNNAAKYDTIGWAETTLADIVTSRGAPLQLQLLNNFKSNRRKNGFIHLFGEEVSAECRDSVLLSFSARNLSLSGFSCYGIDSFLQISRVTESGTFLPVFTSEVMRANRHPSFHPIKLAVSKLCNGDHHRPLQIAIYDHRMSGRHVLIGSHQTSLSEILASSSSSSSSSPFLVPFKPNPRDKSSGTGKGVLCLDKCQYIREASFLQYVRSGFELCLHVAIDFTASNLEPSDPKSLHYLPASSSSTYTSNEYLQAIREVGSILLPYDQDKQVPCYGFGAQIPPDRQVSHCFPLTFDWNNVEVNGLDGILDVYKHALKHVSLSGPTLFAPLLRHVADVSQKEEMKYHILLLITDGIISDMKQTIAEIVRASSMPLSIVIIGVGSADFANMDVLDADDEPLADPVTGLKQTRDNVQFVAMREFKGRPSSLLSAATMEEIPAQFIHWANSRGILPEHVAAATRASAPPLPLPEAQPAINPHFSDTPIQQIQAAVESVVLSDVHISETKLE